MEELKTITEFVQENKIRLIKCEDVAENPNIQNDDWQANHYKITLKRGYQVLTTYFSKGIALDHGVTVEELLDCMANDCSFSGENFNDWCDEYGYSNDSIKALEIYKTIKRQTRQLTQFLGEKLFNNLLNDVERL